MWAGIGTRARTTRRTDGREQILRRKRREGRKAPLPLINHGIWELIEVLRTVTGGTSSPQHDYTGHRISTGSAMPQHLRADVAVAFLEPWAQLFGCCVERTRPGAGGPARVHIGRLRTAVEHAAVVHRVPRNPGRARAGFNEGPVMLVQCRAPTTLAPLLTPRAATSTVVKAAADAAPEVVTEPEVPLAADAGMATETAPATTTTPPPHASPPSAAAPFSERSSAFDLLRELAAMLSTAQQRAREGATEVVPGRDEHAAWAHEPRFPGTDGEARGTPLVHDHDEAAILGRAGDVAAATDDPPRPRGGDDKEPEPKRRSLGRGSVEGPRPSGPSLEQRAAIRRGLIRRSRQPPRETWEPNVEYRRVGMEAGADADTVRRSPCPITFPRPRDERQKEKCFRADVPLAGSRPDLHARVHEPPPRARPHARPARLRRLPRGPHELRDGACSAERQCRAHRGASRDAVALVGLVCGGGPDGGGAGGLRGAGVADAGDGRAGPGRSERCGRGATQGGK